MNPKEKKQLIKLIKKLELMSWKIEPREEQEGWYDIELSGYKKG